MQYDKVTTITTTEMVIGLLGSFNLILTNDIEYRKTA